MFTQDEQEIIELRQFSVEMATELNKGTPSTNIITVLNDAIVIYNWITDTEDDS